MVKNEIVLHPPHSNARWGGGREQGGSLRSGATQPNPTQGGLYNPWTKVRIHPSIHPHPETKCMRLAPTKPNLRDMGCKEHSSQHKQLQQTKEFTLMMLRDPSSAELYLITHHLFKIEWQSKTLRARALHPFPFLFYPISINTVAVYPIPS